MTYIFIKTLHNAFSKFKCKQLNLCVKMKHANLRHMP